MASQDPASPPVTETDAAQPAAPVSPQMSPYLVDLEAGKAYFFCTCGRSGTQPFCDGAHKGTGMQPLRFVAEDGGPVSLCGCKMTDDAPFCDGSHNLY